MPPVAPVTTTVRPSRPAPTLQLMLYLFLRSRKMNKRTTRPHSLTVSDSNESWRDRANIAGSLRGDHPKFAIESKDGNLASSATSSVGQQKSNGGARGGEVSALERRTMRIALLPGDGIGPEVTAEARRLFEVVAAIEGL